MGGGGGRKRWFYFEAQGYQPYSSGVEPGTVSEFGRALSTYIINSRREWRCEERGGGAYNSKLQPPGTYWQLPRVALPLTEHMLLLRHTEA